MTKLAGEEGGEQACLGGVEKAVHLAPWEEEPRRKLTIVRGALNKSSSSEQ